MYESAANIKEESHDFSFPYQLNKPFVLSAQSLFPQMHVFAVSAA